MMNAIPKAVCSNTLKEASWNNTRLLKGDAARAVAELKQEPGKDVFVFGSARLSDALIRAGLFDEYRICLAPVVLGNGVPLFKPGPEQRRLKLTRVWQLKTGGVVLWYVPAHAA
jgi:dihydrofolate reductase